MSKSLRVYVIVVLEDTRHEMLVRRYLKKKGMGEREMRIERSPSGRGNAEGWVRKTFLTEVNEYRRRQAKTALIVVIDADNLTVQDRWRQLDQALEEGGKRRVDVEHEQIARLVPKRNVETWILCLNGHDVDEEADYKRTRDDWNDLIPQAAGTLSEWTHHEAEPPSHCVDSLRSGVKELNRLRI
jgi:hypothetical protein